MVRLAPRFVLIAALLAAAAVHAQTPAAPNASAPSPVAVPPSQQGSAPSSIDDLLNQSTNEDDAPAQTATPGLTAEALDLRIRGASAAAQGLQGPMDGSWSLQGTDGAPLYTFQFVDSPYSNNGLEGAWRDLRRGDGLGGTGLIATLQRSGGVLQASFNPKGGKATASVSLIQTPGGGWTGELVQDGVSTPVKLIRSEPMLNATPLRNPGAGTVSPYHYDNTRAAPAARKGKAVKGKKGKAAKAVKGKRGAAAKGAAKKGGAKKPPAKKKKR